IPHKRSISQTDSCSRCPSSNKIIRLSDDYAGTIKSSTHSHRRRTTGSIDCPPSTSSTSYHQSIGSTTLTPQYCPAASPAYSTLEIENSKTKYKLDQLRLVMQQKKERREARKLKNAPYNTGNRAPVENISPNTTTTTITAVASPTNTTQPPASSPNANVESIIEEVDTVA
ncbi:unnamed protein product, partial [Sphagnum compactum]